MRTIEQVTEELSKPFSYRNLAEDLNRIFGQFGWENEIVDGYIKIRVMLRIPEGVLSLTRTGKTPLDILETFKPNEEPPYDQRKSARESIREQQSPQTQPEPPVPAQVPPRSQREVVNKAIALHSEIIIKKNIRSLDELRAMVAAYGVNRKEDLSDEQAAKLLEQLRQICK